MLGTGRGFEDGYILFERAAGTDDGVRGTVLG